MLCLKTDGLKKLQGLSWNFSCATGKQPRKELASHKAQAPYAKGNFAGR